MTKKPTIHVVCGVIKKHNEVLICQRNNKGVTALKYEFPGGKIEKNETNEQALIREIKEELSIDIVVDNFLQKIIHEYDSIIVHLYAYLCHIENGDIILNEHIDYKWVNSKSIYDYDFGAGDEPIIETVSKLLTK